MRLILTVLMTFSFIQTFANSDTGVTVLKSSDLVSTLSQGGVYQTPNYVKLASTRIDETDSYCDVMYPGEIDDLGRRCVDSTRYAVLYDGKILDGECYRNIDEAYEVVDTSRICQMPAPAEVDNCTIMSPQEQDDLRRRCQNPSFYAVEYDGYIIDSTCFATADEALDKAIRTRACKKEIPLTVGSCKMLNPGASDRARFKCVNHNFYNFTFRGRIVGNQCHGRIDQVLRAMKTSRTCRR